jgi:hypothetical protein
VEPVISLRQRILVVAAFLAIFSPALRSEQSQKASRATQEDRLKKLEERADSAEKTASAAAMEKDYLTRTQKQYESYYQKALNTQIGTVAIMGLILAGVFVLVARFSLKMIDQQTKNATGEAMIQMRNEYARVSAKDVQKLWDSNAADVKKLREPLTAQFAEIEQKLNHRSNLQMQFVQALAEGLNERQGDSLLTFRAALGIYKSGKPRNLIEAKVGATIARSIFESHRKTHSENYMDKAREELADALYGGLEEELALAALQSPWLTPLINERKPTVPEPAAPEPVAEARPIATTPQIVSPGPDSSFDEQSDSCRLIST